MNTLLDIVLWGIDQELAEIVSEKIIRKIKELQKVLDCHDPAAETFQLNQTANSGEVLISSVLFKTIKKGIKDFHRSQGYFNIFAGKAYTSLKEMSSTDKKVHTPDSLMEMMAFDESQNKIRFLHKDVSLDFGGIGKGLALDEASMILAEMEIKNVFISFGGSSILTRGHHPHGNYWPFTFQHESLKEEVWPLRNDAVSVSSARYGSGNTSHILNPLTGQPSNGLTAGVQSDSAAEAEVLSTALIASSPDKHQEIASHFNVKKWAVFNTH